MKLKSKNGDIDPNELRSEIYGLRDTKSKNCALGDLEKKFDSEKLKNALKRSLSKREIFMYDGNFIPWGELMDYYDEISEKILSLVTDLERTFPDGVDPVHIWDSDSEKSLNYYKAADKLNISWNALIAICKEMNRRGEISADD